MAIRKSEYLNLFRNIIFDEHIRNLKQMIHNYRTSIENEGIVHSPNIKFVDGLLTNQLLNVI